jgi:hypothetical protein
MTTPTASRRAKSAPARSQRRPPGRGHIQRSAATRRFHGHQRCVGRHSHPHPTPAQVGPPLAGRPYDLRHAGVSLWLAAGYRPRVAERAGHSVEVLLRLYATCLGDDETIANTRIDAALRDS